MKHILYTAEEGGVFHHIAFEDDEKTTQEFHKIVKNKRLDYRRGDRLIRTVPAYVVLVEGIHDFDFVLGRARDYDPIEPVKEEAPTSKEEGEKA